MQIQVQRSIHVLVYAGFIAASIKKIFDAYRVCCYLVQFSTYISAKCYPITISSSPKDPETTSAVT